MDCPYCSKAMEKGIIRGDRYSIKWIEESRDKGPIVYPFIKGLKLTSAWEDNSIIVYYCRDCNKMIIDLDEIND